MLEDDPEYLINSLRKSFLVHSYIYYRLGTSVIPDTLFDARAKHLNALHKRFPEVSEKCAYQEYFKDFSPSTGMDVPDLPEIIEEANRMIGGYN